MFKGLFSAITSWFDPVTDLVDELHTSAEEKAEFKIKLQALQLEHRLAAMNHIQELTKTQADVLLAEINGKSAMQRNWRPTLMYVCIGIIANNFLFAPYMQAIFGWSVMLVLPTELWALMTLGVGGYIGGRTFEKITETKTQLEHAKISTGADPTEPISEDESFNLH